MKKYIYILLAFFSLMSCKEDYIGQYPTDNEPPAPVNNIRVDNLQGKVTINYDLPDVTDIMGVKAKYYFPGTNEYKELLSSAYSSSITLTGFGKSTSFDVTLVSMDNSYNESTPVTVKVEPLDSPIYNILNSLEVTETFGGLILKWYNEFCTEIALGVVMKKDGEIVDVDSFYSSAQNATYAFHGLPSEPTEFGFYCKDNFRNCTDTLYAEYTPIYEEMLDKKKFVPYLNTKKFPYHNYGGGSITMMWDDVYNVDDNLFYVNNKASGTPKERPYFGMDLGVTAKLSRIKLWTRYKYVYQLHHVRNFEVYGTNDPGLGTTVDGFDGWDLIAEFESIRPSGKPAGEKPTNEENDYVHAGEEWQFPEEAKAYRYLKFRITRTWSDSDPVFINEMELYGAIVK